MNKPIRVRFAPSPTGPLHIGGLRTALFNYLFAKKSGGTFVLRIEDTDQKRYVNGAEDYIKDALDWCQIPFDEGPGKDGGLGPYRQSERKHLYQGYADSLVKNKKAYYAFDTAESLEKERKTHEEKGKTFIYNWHNRTKGRLLNSLVLSEEEVQSKIAKGEDYVIRFLSPEGQTLELSDAIRGRIKIDTNTLDDKVLFKSDGMPTYHLANVVDDYLMEITHVIRGEEWLPSLALHTLLYASFGWEAPKFAHLPLILKPSGKGKLSKRDGDKLGFPVFPLNWEDPKTHSLSKGYKEAGYFPEAVVNFLVFLGWNPGTEQEMFDLESLISAFSLEKVNKAGARFDPDKTKWFNQQYMQKTTAGTLVPLFGKYNEEGKFLPWLMRISHNLVIDYFRKNKRMPKVAQSKSLENFNIFDVIGNGEKSKEDDIMEGEQVETLKRLISELPKEQLEVLVMRHYEDLSFKEISKKTGVSINTALGRMRYALINIRKLMKENNVDLIIN